MAKAKTTQIFVVRNHLGQFLATYRAYTADQAIARLISDDHSTASTFRKSQPSTKFIGLTAKVEG